MIQPNVEFTLSNSDITFNIKDRYKILQKKLQTSLFLGTNLGYTGLEGEENLKDRPKPLGFGKCLNVAPVMVNTQSLKYMVHNGRIHSVLAVYDKGVALTYTATTPTASEWSVDLLTGIITLGSLPDGDITCDFEGAAPSGVYLSNVRTIIAEILVSYCDIAIGDLSSDFATFSPTETVGIYIDTDTDRMSIIDDLCNSIGAYCLFDIDGKVRIGLVDSVRPDTFSVVLDETEAVLTDESGAVLVDNDSTSYNSAAPIATIESYEILEITKYSGNTSIPSYRIELSYGKNFTVQKSSALAGSVSDDLQRVEWLKDEWRKVIVETPNISTVFKSSEKFEYQSLVVSLIEAQDVAIRLSRLYNVKRDFYSVVLPVELAYTIDLGDVVLLKINRFSMDNGTRFLVVGKSDFMPTAGQITLELWG